MPVVTVSKIPVVVAVPVVREMVPESESARWEDKDAGVPGDVPAAAPTANVAVPVPAIEVTPSDPAMVVLPWSALRHVAGVDNPLVVMSVKVPTPTVLPPAKLVQANMSVKSLLVPR